jgi:hypothetical protein
MNNEPPYIEITVSEEAEVTVEAKNSQGGACLEATMEIENDLGLVKERVKKPSFFQRAVSTVKKVRVGQ